MFFLSPFPLLYSNVFSDGDQTQGSVFPRQAFYHQTPESTTNTVRQLITWRKTEPMVWKDGSGAAVLCFSLSMSYIFPRTLAYVGAEEHPRSWGIPWMPPHTKGQACCRGSQINDVPSRVLGITCYRHHDLRSKTHLSPECCGKLFLMYTKWCNDLNICRSAASHCKMMTWRKKHYKSHFY